MDPWIVQKGAEYMLMLHDAALVTLRYISRFYAQFCCSAKDDVYAIILQLLGFFCYFAIIERIILNYHH